MAEVSGFNLDVGDPEIHGSYIKISKPTSTDEGVEGPAGNWDEFEYGDYKFVTVKISPPREDTKPLMIEFRHYEGTTDLEVITRWVIFAGYFVALFALQNIEFWTMRMMLVGLTLLGRLPKKVF